MSVARLFDVPAQLAEPPEPPELADEAFERATAEDIKAALRRRHPGVTHGSIPGQWTCIEEWLGIDLLALNAWRKADVIGYEVKVSRSDLRRELLNPEKRANAVRSTTEFYFAVPKGLLTAEEVAFEEPEWQDGDFQRPRCPNPECMPAMGRRLRHRGGDHEAASVHVRVPGVGYVTSCCLQCRGAGDIGRSRVEREAPTLWVPRDVGLVTVSQRGCRVVKASPRRKDPQPIATTQQRLNDLVRWVSHRPDPRHR